MYLECWCNMLLSWIHSFEEGRALFLRIFSCEVIWPRLILLECLISPLLSFFSFFQYTYNIETIIARCKLATTVSSISFNFSSVASTGLPSISSRQLSFLKIVIIFNFHKENFLQLNFSVPNFDVMVLHQIFFSQLD